MEENNSARTLRLFKLELPDPNQDLFYQAMEPKPTDFINFPKLPLELRLKIWKHTFPPGGTVAFSDLYYSFEGIMPRPSLDRPWPIALFVNSESRMETRKHYKIFWTASNLSPPSRLLFGNRPFCLSPTRDVVELWSDSYPPTHPFLTFARRYACYFNAVRIVEIPIGANLQQHTFHFNFEVLKHFRSLEELHVASLILENVDGTLQYTEDGTSQRDEELAAQIFSGWFRDQHEMDSGRSVPEIFLGPYSTTCRCLIW